MEEDILRAVERISGRLSRDCYLDLCRMVEAAIPCMPGNFSLEALYPAAQQGSGKGRSALTRSLSRAADDVWLNGDREELARLFQHPLRDKPSPKDLIRALAMSVRRARTSGGVRYHVLEFRYPRRFAIVGESGAPPTRLIVLISGRERAEAEQAAERLSREQVPLEEAGERLLQTGELLPPVQTGET